MDIYLDNASTTFPKPKIVTDSIYDYLVNVGGNANRSSHSNSLDSSRYLLYAREKVADFFNFSNPSNVIFTNNITTSLNVLIRGTLKSGDHVISSSMEHNSILRPLTDCSKNNIEVTLVSANKLGFIDPIEIENSIKENTKLIVVTHASNVTGTIQNIKEIGKIAKKHNIFFVIDTAQSAGVLKVDMKDLNTSAIAFTGHKSLFGPQGVGGFVINDELNSCCKSLLSGGTGSLSYDLNQPDFLPDKFESGTANMPGIVGLTKGIEFINEIGLDAIREKSSFLRNKFIDGILNIGDFIVYGPTNSSEATSCISINHKSLDPSEISFLLNDEGIKTRAGLHCAPLAHKTIGSFPAGTVRFSLSYFNSIEDIDYALKTLNNLKNNI
ncbi:cysteine desulfurase family protein [Clostridium sp. DSM 8431]|uniref:aminotransferase class V-fold PLP-dependent enzyme n=1 Tax=Clostridium sp. DSM 8431 TaxID=1761781 RepID=UPI0008F3ED72|nr:aminotransferase class V-fold PLP-dependent enzyme [Clostridium sp. DSM 8431]SFU62535.1 cysteine desulfurase family protein [Clostridium sp. DSM 8431]